MVERSALTRPITLKDISDAVAIKTPIIMGTKEKYT